MQKLLIYFLLLIWFASCKSEQTAAEEDTITEAKTPVTVTGISMEPMLQYVELNATSAYLQTWIVRSNATGYLQSANVQLNKYVSNGQTLYTVKTKEAQGIGNTISILDSTFKFK